MKQALSWVGDSFVDHETDTRNFKALVGGKKRTFRLTPEAIEDKGVDRLLRFAEHLARGPGEHPDTITITNRGHLIVCEKAPGQKVAASRSIG